MRLKMPIFFVLFLGLLLSVSETRSETLRPFFYRIEKDGQVAHLLGTIHSGVNYSELPAGLREVAKASASLVIETDLIKAQPLMAAAFPMGDADSLKNQLDADEWTRFENVMRALSAQSANPDAFMSIVGRLHPVMANLYFTMASLPPTREPMDAVLLGEASAAGKPLHYFEAPELQVELLAKTQGLAALRRGLNLPEGVLQSQVAELVAAYRSGDEARLLAIFRAQMSAEDERLVLLERNAAWLAGFDAIFQQPGAEFIAVGAGHLLGPSGLLAGLRAQGYTVTEEAR